MRQNREKSDFHDPHPTDFISEDLAMNYIHVKYHQFQGRKHKINDTKASSLPKSLLMLPTPSRPLKAIDQVMVSILVSKKLRPFYLERSETDYM